MPDYAKFTREEIEQFIRHYANERLATINRIDRLLDFYMAHEKDEGADDILRAAVVLLHATVDHLIRTIAQVTVPYRGPSAFAGIAWPGLDGKEKIAVADLVKYRNEHVNNVLTRAAVEHYERLSFNNPTDIATFCRQLKVDTHNLEPYFSDLGALSTRRHQIVHRADAGRNGAIDAIAIVDVLMWRDAVRHFAKSFVDAVVDAEKKAWDTDPQMFTSE